VLSVLGNLFRDIDENLIMKALVLAETCAGLHAKCPLLLLLYT